MVLGKIAIVIGSGIIGILVTGGGDSGKLPDLSLSSAAAHRPAPFLGPGAYDLTAITVGAIGYLYIIRWKAGMEDC